MALYSDSGPVISCADYIAFLDLSVRFDVSKLLKQCFHFKKIRRGSERIIKISTESTFEKNSNIDFFSLKVN